MTPTPPGPPAHARVAVRRLAAARLISLAGTDASAVAVSFGLYAQTGSVRWLTASLLVMFGLGSLFAPLGGVLADRYDRLALMLGCDLLAAAVFAAMAVVHTPAAMLSLCVAATIAGSIQGPAASAAIPAVAGQQHLSWANGLLATGGNVGKTVGRLGGGLLVAALGAGAVFALDALSFLISAGLVWSVRGTVATLLRTAAAERPPRAGRAGWASLAADPTLRLVIGSSCLATLMTSFTMTAEAPLAVALDAGAAGLGALAASWSLGMVGGSALAARVLHVHNEPAGLFGGRVLMGVGIASVAATPIFLPALAGYLLGGAAGGFLLVASTSMIQRAADERTRGRAMAAAEGLKTAAFGAGVLAAGTVVSALGPHATYALVGAGVLLSALPLARLTRVQRPAAHPAPAR
ncbi:MAG: transporter [Solirubrobacterales bacterium]|nr:transporter [Solirubrobacterales bacterium]